MIQEQYEIEGSIKCIEDYCKEQKLFNIDSQVKTLIESLFKKEKEHETQ